VSEAGEAGGRVRLVGSEPDGNGEDRPRLERVFGRDREERPRRDDDPGAVSTEFALLLVLIALVIIAAVTAFGISVGDLFDQGSSGVSGV
jgi:Flp pilus assembly pilin Flp